MSKSNLTDPLAGVRISRSEAEGRQEASPPVPPPEPEPEVKPKKKATPPPRQEKLKGPPVYKVLEMRRVFLRGQACIFRLGKLVSESTHGPGIIELLENAGVKLEKVS